VDLRGLLEGIIESYPRLQPPGVDIRIEGSLPQVLGNEAALTQCFSNLLDNAAKFVAPGIRPQVRIWAEGMESPKSEVRSPSEGRRPNSEQKAEPTGDGKAHGPTYIRLWVADNGIGIPGEAQAQIFKMFQRLDKNYDGTGVGLTVVRKAVEKMGGRVGLESEPGRGSRFWVELKAVAERDAPTSQVRAA
jgi:signal transduction histidine kinase